MPANPRAIFLSYASQDAGVAKHIADALRAANIVVWLDQSELRGGDVWDAHIQRQIAACTLFVPIISARSQGRREGYFRLEWRLAEERLRRMALGTPFLLPIALDGVFERDALVPRSFLDVQWSRLPHGEITDEFVRLAQQMLVNGTLRGETLMYVPAVTGRERARPATPVPLPMGRREPHEDSVHRPARVTAPRQLRWMLVAVGMLAVAAIGAWMLLAP